MLVLWRKFGQQKKWSEDISISLVHDVCLGGVPLVSRKGRGDELDYLTTTE